MGGRDERGWNVLSSVLGKLDNPVSVTSLIRRGGKNSPVAISTWSTLALIMCCYRRGRGRVRRAEHLTSTRLTWIYVWKTLVKIGRISEELTSSLPLTSLSLPSL